MDAAQVPNTVCDGDTLEFPASLPSTRELSTLLLIRNSRTLDTEAHRVAMWSARPNTGADSSRLLRKDASKDRSRKLNSRLKIAFMSVAVSVATS